MKRATTLLTYTVALAAITTLPAFAQDMAVTAGNAAKVLLDNDKVRVLEVQLAPGGKTGMHSHGDNIVYFVTAGEATQTNADGTSKATTRKAGEVLWSGPVTHDTQNTGKTMTKAVIIELKGPAKQEGVK